MSNELKYAVEPFDGSNFSVWLRRVEAIFTAKQFEKFLEGEADATKPTEVDASKRAYALLLTFLSDRVLVGLAEETTCATILAKLRETYLREGAVSQILVRKILSMLRKRKETSMQDHLDEIGELVNQLKSCDVKISSMDIIVYILMSLPAEYDAAKSAIENQPSENLTVEFVRGRLLDAIIIDSKFDNKKAQGWCDIPYQHICASLKPSDWQGLNSCSRRWTPISCGFQIHHIVPLDVEVINENVVFDTMPYLEVYTDLEFIVPKNELYTRSLPNKDMSEPNAPSENSVLKPVEPTSCCVDLAIPTCQSLIQPLNKCKDCFPEI